MNVEKIIKEKRNLEYAIKRNNDEETILLLNKLVEEYYNNLKLCEHEMYLDYGYYKYHNMDIYEVNKEQAEFRVLTCPKCNNKITLLKRDNLNWDCSILDKKLSIISPLELNPNTTSIDILRPAIQSLLYPFFHLEQTSCGHIEFSDNGYYKIIHNQIEKSNREESDFRVVTCNCCRKNYLLPKRENPYWDVTLDNNAITVYKIKEKNKQKVFCK